MRISVTIFALALILGSALFAPFVSVAATFDANKSVILSAPPPDNTYLAGSSVEVTAGIPADLSVVGGTLSVAAPVQGDVLGIGALLKITSLVSGDVRALGGKVELLAPITGDVVAIAPQIVIASSTKDIFAIGGSVSVAGSSKGPVTIYGTDVELDGDYAGDVTVVATNRFALGERAHIAGTLHYNAPTQISVPVGARVDGPVTYTGSLQYVPTNQEAQNFAQFGIGIFFVVHALAAMMLTGLLVGIFPRANTRIMHRVFAGSVRRNLLTILLGLALFALVPLAILLLIVTFAGIYVAFLLGAGYVMLYLLAGSYAGALVGTLLRKNIFHRVRNRKDSTWQDAVVGTLVLYIISFAPYVGGVLNTGFMLLAAGALSVAAYQLAFDSKGEGDVVGE
jgi:hypothetical protein